MKAYDKYLLRTPEQSQPVNIQYHFEQFANST